MAVPPFAVTPRSVRFATSPPSTPTDPTVSPTPMAFPALPPLLTSPMPTAPPLADAVATPPFPANCMLVCPPYLPPRWGRDCPSSDRRPSGWLLRGVVAHSPNPLTHAMALTFQGDSRGLIGI